MSRCPKFPFMLNGRKVSAIAYCLIVCFCFLELASCSEILSPDITDKQLIVNSPADSLFTNSDAVTFWWEKEDAIESYDFRITSGTNGNINLILDTTLLDNALPMSFSDENAYHWQVRGHNEGSTTDWVERDLLIDLTLPDKATAISLDQDTLWTGNSGDITWYSVDFPLAGSIYPTADSLILYRKNDSLTIGARFFFAEDDAKSLSVTANTPIPMNGPGKYFWRVVSIDKAGNRQSSDQFHFWVQ